MAARTDPAARRRSELARIHIGKAQLGLEDDTYRAMLWSVARVHSARDLDAAGRRAVLNHLRARGFRELRPRSPRHGRPHNTDQSPLLRKIEALLADARRPWSYADAMAQRMFGVDRVTFCSPDQQRRLVAALSMDQRRRQKRKGDVQ